ncbi:hypothetical protein CDAR_441161 [Caerostris darwini]|uniref:Uncharacterized protein n=1 Tax=Caerostris darwini TaxID=1538125 RepID=A0AAV4Q501_9ARAC|nr:hypothetical protein CDAR_441161 [Caerostris darwini]
MKTSSACVGKGERDVGKERVHLFRFQVGMEREGGGTFLFLTPFFFSPVRWGKGMLRISSDLVWELSLERVSASTMYPFLLECFEGERHRDKRIM